MVENTHPPGTRFDACRYCWLALAKDGRIVLVENAIPHGFFHSESSIRSILEPRLVEYFKENNLPCEARPQVFTAKIEGLRCYFTMLANNEVCEEVSWMVVVTVLPPENERSADIQALTPREKDVYQWLLIGKTNSEIGMILSISERTVGKHCERIYRKLGVCSRMELLASYWQTGVQEAH